MPISVGVDSHKTSLVVSRDGDRATTFPTTAAGITRLLAHAGSPERFVGEPRGGDERPLLAALPSPIHALPASSPVSAPCCSLG